MKRILYSIMLLTITGNILARETPPQTRMILRTPLHSGAHHSGPERSSGSIAQHQDNPMMEKLDTLFNEAILTFTRSGKLLLEEEAQRTRRISNALEQLNKKFKTQMSKEENAFLMELSKYVANIPAHIEDALTLQQTTLLEAHNVMKSRMERMGEGIHEFMNAQEEVSRAARQAMEPQSSARRK